MSVFFPEYQFTHYIGQVEERFAYLPTKLWDGRWIFRKKYWRRLSVTLDYLDGPQIRRWVKTA